MRAPLSIVIPTLNAAAELPATLASLFEGVGAGLVREVIISDGGSQDDTATIAAEVGAAVVTGPAGRGGQLRLGAATAQGEWLLFLHADTWLSEGWPETVAHHITHSRKAGYFRLKFRAKGLAPQIVAGWANLRSRVGLPYGDQGLLISRQLYDQTGGYPDHPLMEDVFIAKALHGHLEAIPGHALTSAAGYQRDGWMRRGLRNLSTLIRYLAGTSPDTLARRYTR